MKKSANISEDICRFLIYPSSISLTASITRSLLISLTFLLSPIIRLESQILLIILGIPFDALAIASRAVSSKTGTMSRKSTN